MENNYNTGRGGWPAALREKAVEAFKKADVALENPYNAVKNVLGIEIIKINRVPKHPPRLKGRGMDSRGETIDTAGGFVDPASPQRIGKTNLRSFRYLNDNDSTAFLKKVSTSAR